jgi:hypothetical protein
MIRSATADTAPGPAAAWAALPHFDDTSCHPSLQKTASQPPQVVDMLEHSELACLVVVADSAMDCTSAALVAWVATAAGPVAARTDPAADADSLKPAMLAIAAVDPPSCYARLRRKERHLAVSAGRSTVGGFLG